MFSDGEMNSGISSAWKEIQMQPSFWGFYGLHSSAAWEGANKLGQPSAWGSDVSSRQMLTQEDAAHEFKHNLLVPRVQTSIVIVIQLELLSFFKPFKTVCIILALLHVLLVSL